MAGNGGKKRKNDNLYSNEESDQETEPPSKNLRTQDDNSASQHEKHYTIEKVSEKKSLKYSMLETTYKVKFKEDAHGENLQDMRKDLERMFSDVLERTERYSDDDRAHISIHHDGLQQPIYIHCQPRHQITPKLILDR